MKVQSQVLLTAIAGLLVIASSALAARPAAAPAAPAAVPGGQPAVGETVFKQRCAVCHSVAPGAVGMGPNMQTLYGRRAGSLPGFNYSTALKGSALTWTAASLDTFLQGPSKMVPGTRMMVMVPKADDRSDLIAYFAALRQK